MFRTLGLALAAACTTAPPPTAEPPATAAPEPTAKAEPAAASKAAPAAVNDGNIALETSLGTATFTPVYHATMLLQVGDRTVWFDPWSKAALDGKPKADVIVLTDIHQDHMDAEAIGKVSKEGTVFVAPPAVQEGLADIDVDHVIGNGESVDVGDLKITGVPMYNLTRGPEPGKLFHTKGRGNGYIVELGDRRVYVAGDTACTPDMKALKDIDLAFVPMNLPYTMPPDEAAACVKAFAPQVVVPFHYAGSDLQVFEDALKDADGVTVAKVEFYPGGLPW